MTAIAAALVAISAACAMGQAGAVAAQVAGGSGADAPYVPTMTFEVASVRENKDVDTRGFTMMPWNFVRDTATFHANNVMIENLIGMTYGVQHYQIVGAPNWPWPTLFMIEAKGGSEADAKLAALTGEQRRAEQQHMVQSLLEERFKLKVHWETREGEVYNLVMGKGGPKLGAEGSIPPSDEEKKRFGDRPVPTLYQTGCGEHGCIYIAHGCSMGELVRSLTPQLGAPVTDQTTLTGKYDFVLKYKGARERDRPADDMDPTPPMDRALQEQLGLKVETAKGPVKVLVIDHVEKPSAN
jgi:uncharacterized protein (TIGR03435 family)